MPAPTTEKTGADKAAETLAEKLRAAGWTTRTGVSEGHLSGSTVRVVAIHADGPRAVGTPFIHAYWVSDGQAVDDVKFDGADIHVGATQRLLDTWAELDSWVDALIAVAAAVNA